jgi:predicted TIM-barrel fold metal-dependent hydrolase
VFAQVLGTFLRFGGEDRIVWASGCMAMHPRGLIDAFMAFQMPPELALGFGLPEITPEIKRKVLGENFARIHGLDIEDLKRGIEGDEFSGQEGYAEPWSRAPERWGVPA